MNQPLPVLRRAAIVSGVCTKCGSKNQGLADRDTTTNGWVRTCGSCGKVAYFDQDGNLDPEVAALTEMQRRSRPRLDRRSVHELTTRQQKLMRLAMAGCSNAEIGETLGLSTGNVRAQIQGISKKLGVPKRDDLVNFVRSEGLADGGS